MSPPSLLSPLVRRTAPSRPGTGPSGVRPSPSRIDPRRVGHLATNLRRMLKFGAVGCSGMVVNLVVVGLAFEVVFAQLADGPRHAAAFAAGIGLSIVSNFLLNDCWTWRDRRPSHRGAAARWLRFSAVSLVAAALQFGIAMTLSVGMGWGYMVAQTVGIGVASIVNFVTNDLWTFGAGRGTCAGSGAGGGTRAGDRAT